MLSSAPRHYTGTGAIALLFFGGLGLCLAIPRFYCRFVCPLGALFGVLSRYSVWRIGKSREDCSHCKRCEAVCEGACEPDDVLRWNECVVCLNCTEACGESVLRYRTAPSASGERAVPDVHRRGVLVSFASGLAAVPLVRLGGSLADNWRARVLRPPGAMPEAELLDRCIRCGQCMRICPTNIIQPAGGEAGIEGLWTPVLNFRIGTSGCQYNCVACGHVCPTAAIRPLSLAEKHGTGEHAGAGPVRMGTAFVDRGRCLPWAMGKPCIVCQENCPVSPKAIRVLEAFDPVRDGERRVAAREQDMLTLAGPPLQPGAWATGDYYCAVRNEAQALPPWRIVSNGAYTLTLAPARAGSDAALPTAGTAVSVLIRLQRPAIDPTLCIGCGVCEHECPVSGLRAIRVTAENETRERKHSMTL